MENKTMQNITIQNKKAFTVVEILLTLSIMGFMILMITLNTVKQTPDIDKAKYKKAYLTVEQAVSNMINDDNLYSSSFQGFKQTDRVVTEFGEIIGNNPEEKFRDAFEFYVDPIKNNLTCRLADGSTSNKCFIADDGVVYGIPDTNFGNSLLENKYEIKEGVASLEKFLPITVYTNWERVKDDIDLQEQEAMYIGVQYDGNMRIFYPDTCGDSNKHRYCKAEEYILSESIKRKEK